MAYCAEIFEQLIWTILHTCYLFLTKIVICSFNNNVLEKCAYGTAFYIMASAQFFATLVRD